ncbi:N-acetylmuramoyl-L-alanine amidase [Rossellomorea marisflavi]|uniref:peptidoglycan recognition protein family protein n=1 Tax=Rossellomorea marisflavi TaxID=189381 RepID=UPI0025AFD606|nr:N-acetylmuramoyl-L-alanine amidase [Rossellomorea marisflavi]WJV20675.1 N-acetylmuramoyl-L-alanine amidase [Rossellomorea marisflavi]
MVQLNYKVKHIKKHDTTRPGIKLLRVQAVVDHWTANFGATAEGHFTYFNSTLPDTNDRVSEKNKRYASAHIFVDKNEAIELVPLDEVCFHANDGGTSRLKLSALKATHHSYKEGNANLLTIGIEMCVEADGTIHPDTIKRTALVHKYLQSKFPDLKDTKNRFVRHYDVTGKNCPAPMVTDKSKYDELLKLTDEDIKLEAPKKDVQPAAKPSTPSPTPAKKGDMKTTSIVTYLQSIGENSNFSNREKLAAKYGIKGYKGTASQNTKLLSLMRKGSSPVPSKPKAPAKSSGIKSIGKVKIVGVTNAAIIQNIPDRRASKSLGSISKGSTIEIAGSVKGKNNTRGYWEVIYKGKRAYISAQFGKLI